MASAYLFARTEYQENDQKQLALKIGSHFTFNAFWGATICNFLINFLPQVNLGLCLPLCFFAAFFDASVAQKSFRPAVEGSGSIIAWFYSNETTLAATALYGGLGMMAGLGLVMLTPSYRWLKGDTL